MRPKHSQRTRSPLSASNASGPIDFSGTFAELTSRGRIPFLALGFFPAGVYTGATAAGPTGPSSPSAADWATILTNWKTLIQAFFDALIADGRFGAAAIQNWSDMRVLFAHPFKPRMTQQYPAWRTALSIAYDLTPI